MRNRIIKHIGLILSFIFILSNFAYADSNIVVTLGKDVDNAQRTEILKHFDVDKSEVDIIEVNNEEEREYLEGVATEQQLGKLTMSSAYVELLEEGSGISVETHNISWVTKEMYASALATAGVKNAKVIAAAPFPVSGTGALTGILKAFEQATGEKIDEEQKKVANEEVVVVGELGEELGQAEASELINEVKEQIIGDKVKDPEEIKKIIVEISVKLDMDLSDEQVQKLTDLMVKITKLDLNIDNIKDQLKDIGSKIDDTLKNEEVQSFFAKVLESIKNFFSSIFK